MVMSHAQFRDAVMAAIGQRLRDIGAGGADRATR